MTSVSNNKKPTTSSGSSSPQKPKPTKTQPSNPSGKGSSGVQPTSSQGSSSSTNGIGGIPQGVPFKPTGSDIRPTGPQGENSQSTNNKDSQDNYPTTGKEWLKHLHQSQGNKGSDKRVTMDSSGKKTTDAPDPRTGKEWLQHLKDNLPKTGKEWLSYLRNGAQKVFDNLNAARGKLIGNVAKPTWDNNVLAAFASNSQDTVGWFGSQGTAMSDWVSKNAPGHAKGVLGALANHIGKGYPGFPQNARTKGWQSEVGGTTFLNSIFNPTKNNVQKGLEVFYAGFARGGGNDNWAFAKGTNKFNAALEKDLGDNNVTSFRRNQATTRDMEQVFGKIAAYAKANPNKPVTVLAHWNTHGGRHGGGKEGGANGFDMFGNEAQKKQLVAKYFGSLKNVAVVPILESCHAGSQLS